MKAALSLASKPSKNIESGFKACGKANVQNAKPRLRDNSHANQPRPPHAAHPGRAFRARFSCRRQQRAAGRRRAAGQGTARHTTARCRRERRAGSNGSEHRTRGAAVQRRPPERPERKAGAPSGAGAAGAPEAATPPRRGGPEAAPRVTGGSGPRRTARPGRLVVRRVLIFAVGAGSAGAGRARSRGAAR